VQLLTGLGADLEEVTIHNPSGWQQPYLVKVRTLSVKVAFLPLLRRQIEVSTLTLRHGDVFLERNAQGQMNYADLMAPAPKAGSTTPAPPGAAPPAAASPLAALLVSQVLLQDVNVSFIDQMVVPGQTHTTTARNLHAEITNAALNTPIDFDMSTALLTEGSPNLRVRGRLGPIPETFSVDHTPIQIAFQAKDVSLAPFVPYLGPTPVFTAGRLGADLALQGQLGGSLSLSGSLSLAQGVLHDFTGTAPANPLPEVTLTPNITLDLAQALLQLVEVRLELPPLQVVLKGTVQTVTTTPRFDVQLTTNDFAPQELLTQLPMLAAALPTPADVQGRLQLQGTVKGVSRDLHTETRLAATSLSLKSGTFSGVSGVSGVQEGGGFLLETANTHAILQTHLSGSRPPDARLDLRAERLLVDQQPAAAAAPAPAAPAPPQAPARPPPSAAAQGPSATPLPPLNLHGTATIAEGQIKRLPFQQMHADFSLHNGLLKSTQTFMVYGGTCQGELEANLVQASPAYTLDMKLAQVNAGSLVNELTSAQNVLHGILDTDLKAAGRGLTWPEISTTLTGNGKVQIADLKLTSLELMPHLAQGLHEVSRLAGFTLPAGFTERSFDTLQAAFHIAQGKVHADSMWLTGPEVEVQAKGTLGLDQSLHFEGTAFLLSALATSLGPGAAFLQDKEGRIPLPFTVQGTVQQPQIVVSEAYVLDLARKALTGKIGEKAGQELQKLLHKALPGKPAAPEPADKGEQKESTPQEQLEKALRGLFKR
jgi:AsmA protein